MEHWGNSILEFESHPGSALDNISSFVSDHLSNLGQLLSNLFSHEPGPVQVNRLYGISTKAGLEERQKSSEATCTWSDGLVDTAVFG